jgi:hypothetical protein
VTAAELLGMLEGVRKSGEGWMARCPAHEDRTASLSVGEGSDGRVLLRCFAECDVFAICDSLGIEPRDLFPPRIDTYGAPARPPRVNGHDLLRALAFEATVVRVAATTLANGYGLSAADYRRLELAESRLADAVGVAA